MKILKELALAALALFAPVEAALATVLGLIIVDMILGIAAAVKRKEPITSAGLRRTLTKLFVFESALMIGFVAETYLISGVIPVTKIVSTFIGMTELKSIFENLNEINGSPILSQLISKLGSINDLKK